MDIHKRIEDGDTALSELCQPFPFFCKLPLSYILPYFEGILNQRKYSIQFFSPLTRDRQNTGVYLAPSLGPDMMFIQLNTQMPYKNKI